MNPDISQIYKLLLGGNWKVGKSETLTNGFVAITLALIANKNCKNTYLLVPRSVVPKPTKYTNQRGRR